tara:strand:+ start:2168 stop:3751 length:1584 start_codon:yes stop_codon:yes gene_type:complete
MSTTKVTTGLITSLDSAKLTGSVDVARLPSTVLNSNVATTDLTAVHQGIATLGLHMGVADNKVAFNLPNSFIDVFQDSSGITTTTDTIRNASEYVSAVTTGVGSQTLISGGTGTIIGTQLSAGLWDGSNTTGQISGQGGDNWSGKDWGVGVTKTINGYGIWNNENTYGIGVHDTTVNVKLQGSTDGFSSSIVDLGETGAVADGQGQTYPFHISKLTGITTTTAYRYHRILIPSSTNVDVRWSELELYDNPSTLVTNATGTLISDAQTAAESTTEVSGVILYTDNAGTNTLGTGASDSLSIWFSATNGTGNDWVQATSYGASQVFSGSIKQVKLGKTTVPAGTQIAIKAVWANQVATVGGSAGAYVTTDRRSTITTTIAGITLAAGAITTLVDGSTAGGSGTSTNFNASSPATDGSAYIRFQFATTKVINEAKWYSGGTANGTWRWKASNDGSTWVNIGNTFVLSNGSAIQTQTELSGNTTSYTYYQMTFVSGAVNASDWLTEIQFNEGYAAGVTGKVAHLEGWAVNY